MNYFLIAALVSFVGQPCPGSCLTGAAADVRHLHHGPRG